MENLFEELLEEEEVVEEEIPETDEEFEDDEELFMEEDEKTDNEEEFEEVVEKIKLNHLGEDKEVDFEELKVLGQKGLDYDRLKGKLEEMNKRQPDLDTFDYLIEKSGLSKEEFLKAIEDNEKRIEEAETLQKVKMLEERGFDKESAMYIVNLEKENKTLKDERDKKQQQKRIKEDKMKSLTTEIEKFKSLYPDVKNIPDDVMAEFNKGLSLVSAYQEHLLKEKDLKIKQLEQSLKNKQTARAGSLKGTGKSGKYDPFLAGLFEK